MIDYHVHSNISYDGKSSPQEYIDIAHLKGIKEFTFTEHFDYLNGVSNINLDNYYSSFKNLTIPIRLLLKVRLVNILLIL